jgi:hypothetical protein
MDSSPRPRVLGGFAVIPTATTLHRIGPPRQRAAAIRAALDFVEQLRGHLLKARADTAIELHDKHHVCWETVAVRFGTTQAIIYRAAAERRRTLASVAEPLAADQAA